MTTEGERRRPLRELFSDDRLSSMYLTDPMDAHIRKVLEHHARRTASLTNLAQATGAAGIAQLGRSSALTEMIDAAGAIQVAQLQASRLAINKQFSQIRELASATSALADTWSQPSLNLAALASRQASTSLARLAERASRGSLSDLARSLADPVVAGVTASAARTVEASVIAEQVLSELPTKPADEGLTSSAAPDDLPLPGWWPQPGELAEGLQAAVALAKAGGWGGSLEPEVIPKLSAASAGGTALLLAQLWVSHPALFEVVLAMFSVLGIAVFAGDATGSTLEPFASDDVDSRS